RLLPILLAVMALGGLVVLGSPGPASAQLSCTDIGGTDVSGNCTLAAVFVCGASPVTISIPGNFTILAGAGINCAGTNAGTGANGTPGKSLTINVGGNLDVAGFVSVNGGAGGAGGTAGDGGTGAAGGIADINVTGDTTVSGSITAFGGAGGSG